MSKLSTVSPQFGLSMHYPPNSLNDVVQGWMYFSLFHPLSITDCHKSATFYLKTLLPRLMSIEVVSGIVLPQTLPEVIFLAKPRTFTTYCCHRLHLPNALGHFSYLALGQSPHLRISAIFFWVLWIQTKLELQLSERHKEINTLQRNPNQ